MLHYRYANCFLTILAVSPGDSGATGVVSWGGLEVALFLDWSHGLQFVPASYFPLTRIPVILDQRPLC